MYSNRYRKPRIGDTLIYQINATDYNIWSVISEDRGRVLSYVRNGKFFFNADMHVWHMHWDAGMYRPII